MHAGALRALEFDRIVAVVSSLAVTPTGQARLAELHPVADAPRVIALQRATTEGTRFLNDHPGFPLRAPSDLEEILDALAVEGRALESLRLLKLGDYLESIEQSRQAIRKVGSAFPILSQQVDAVASFAAEIADVRRKIEPSGDVADNASPALAQIRDRLRRQKQRLRSTLDSFLRGRETAKYLQEQVVTDRNGRHVLMVRAEHRSAIPGIVHGGSTSGASLFVEPLETVEINNDIVALEEQEAAEVQRILLGLTDAFRSRPEELERTIEVATALDVIQSRARFSIMTGSVEPIIAADGTFELKGARHPLLMRAVIGRLEDHDSESRISSLESRVPDPESRVPDPVAVDILLTPPTRILVITGPNTGGKTVALKTAGLLSAMAQSGLHIPVDVGSRIPVFKSLFADIGDEQSISASLSTFSAHITNIVSMDRSLTLPALVLVDEIGAGTDPVEGGALGIAVIDHFRKRGAHLIATTHYDSLKSYASTTDGVASAAFGFRPETFAPTYRLLYGSPGRSLAIEIAARLGMPPSVIAFARENLSDREKQLAEHLARVDDDLRRLEAERKSVAKERAALVDTERALRSREESVRERENTYRRRLDAKLDEQLREGRREIDTIIQGLKARTAELTEQAARRTAVTLNTGEAGSARADARVALERVVGRLKTGTETGRSASQPPPPESQGPIEPGTKVAIGALGLEGVVIEVHGKHAEIDMKGKRLRAPLRDLRALGRTGQSESTPASVRVNVDLKPREGSLSEVNVIGCTVDEAITRVEKFLDESTVSDQQVVRIIHGHGTGQLRRGLAAFLKEHPLVARFELAPTNQGGGGVTVVELKD
ncbi:MAG TPA: endonuclease MutS2 [Vicinamibacterales bacterium]|nr:endonuclease MutS2 [Vicinamibacterales bacterium]